MKNIFGERGEDSEEHWISISDIMSGLMMIFLFIAVTYMLNVNAEKVKIEAIADTYKLLKNDLYEDLYKEFKNDLTAWDAEIDSKTLSVKFKEPEVLFEAASATVKPRFKEILANFFPRYAAILQSSRYVDDIEEVRIEGHTSSEWHESTGTIEAYFRNMELSQNRTRSVLEYVMGLDGVKDSQEWLKKHVTANGLSFSQRIIDPTGRENRERSRRVEFRVRTNAEQRMVQILEKKKQ